MQEAIKKQTDCTNSQEEALANYQNFISRVTREGGQMERYYKQLLAQAYTDLKLQAEKMKKQEIKFSQTKSKFWIISGVI